jgi:hypothetical protein
VDIDGVVEDEHPGHTAVHVLGRLAVRVRVVPEAGGRLVDRPRRCPRVARLHHLVRATVRARRQVHAVPVQRGRFVDGVRHRDLDLVAA